MRRPLCTAFLTAGVLASCSPAAPDNPRPTAASTSVTLSGRVVDQAGIPIFNARVEVIDGPGAGMSAMTNPVGQYQLQGISTGTILLRASKEDYVTSTTGAVNLPRSSPLDFILQFAGPSLDLTGHYTVTFTADSACTQLPDVARSRTYQASIVRLLSPNSYYAQLSGPTLVAGSSFGARVAGNFASFATVEDGREMIIFDRPAPSTSVTIDFYAGAVRVDRPTVTVPIYGTFRYCTDHQILDDALSCRVPMATCNSSNHTFTLTRN